jgi:hypothetical protein
VELRARRGRQREATKVAAKKRATGYESVALSLFKEILKI